MIRHFTTDTTPFEELGLVPIDVFEIKISNIEYPTNLEFNKKYYEVNKGKIIAFKVLAMALYRDGYYNYSYKLKYYVQYSNGKPIWVNTLKDTPIFTSKEHYIDYINDSNNHIKPFDLGYKYGMLGSSDYLRFLKTYIITKDKQKPIAVESKINHVLITSDGMFVCLSHQFERFGNKYNGYDNYNDCMASYLNNMVVEDFEEETLNINIEVNVVKPSTSILKIVEMK